MSVLLTMPARDRLRERQRAAHGEHWIAAAQQLLNYRTARPGNVRGCDGLSFSTAMSTSGSVPTSSAVHFLVRRQGADDTLHPAGDVMVRDDEAVG